LIGNYYWSILVLNYQSLSMKFACKVAYDIDYCKIADAKRYHGSCDSN